MIGLRDLFKSLFIRTKSCVYNVVYFIDAQGEKLSIGYVPVYHASI